MIADSMGSIQRLTLPPVGDIMNQANFKKSNLNFSSPSPSLSETSAPSSPNQSNHSSTIVPSSSSCFQVVAEYPLHSSISEVEHSANEIIKKLLELKMKPNPTKLDTIWLAHYVSCLNSSFYQLQTCLSNMSIHPNANSAFQMEEKAKAVPVASTTATTVLEPINKLFQIATSASSPSPLLTPTPSTPSSSSSSSPNQRKKQYNFETISYETKSTSSHTIPPYEVNSESSASSRFPQHQHYQQQLSSLKRKSSQVFSHQPHKRAYKHSAPESKEDRHCTSCNTSVTPEWRRGPLGPKSLCNACGLQYAKTLKS